MIRTHNNLPKSPWPYPYQAHLLHAPVLSISHGCLDQLSLGSAVWWNCPSGQGSFDHAASSCLQTVPGDPDSDWPFCPPRTWTAHTMDPGSCRCFTDLVVKADLPRMDHLIAAAFHNLACSPLCRLPEELLVDIMEYLDPLSIQCFRRTSRLFLRLYCSPTFSDSHDTEIFPKALYFHRLEPKLEYWSDTYQLQPLIDRDLREYCTDCRAIRKMSTWNASHWRGTTRSREENGPTATRSAFARREL